MPVESQATSAFQLPFHSVSSRPFDRCVTPITASQPSAFVDGFSPVFYASNCTTRLTSGQILTRDSVSRYHFPHAATFTQYNVIYRDYFIDRSTQACNSYTRALIVQKNRNEFARKTLHGHLRFWQLDDLLNVFFLRTILPSLLLLQRTIVETIFRRFKAADRD